MRNPIVPRNEANPVGTARILGSANKDIRESMKRVGQRTIELFNAIPATQVPADQAGIATNAAQDYQYLISPFQMDEVSRQLENIIVEEMGDGTKLEPYVVSSFNLGTTQEIANLVAQMPTYPITAEAALLSDGHRTRVNIVNNRVFEEMKKLNSDMRANLNRILTTGVIDGQNPRTIARQIYQEIGIPEWNSGNNKASYARALRISRTEINHAHRVAAAAQDQEANRIGVNTKMMWFSALSPTTRVSHAARHGHLYTREQNIEFYGQGAEEINCFAADTEVSGRFVGGSKAWYEGRMVNIVTASGARLTVTPNHPVMTDRGLIPAGEINKLDNLVARLGNVDDGDFSSGLASIGERSSTVTDLNINKMDAVISEVFSSLMEVGHSRLVGVSVVDFHGDGEFINKDVEVVDSLRVLSYAVNAETFKMLDELKFVTSDLVSDADSSSLLDRNRIFLTPSLFVAGVRNKLSVFFGRLFKSVKSGFRSIFLFKSRISKPSANSDPRYSDLVRYLKNAFSVHMVAVNLVNVKLMRNLLSVRDYFNAVFFKDSLNDGRGNADRIGKVVDGASSLVGFDNVVSVDIFDFSGHVYDLEEVSGLMYANSIMVSNCKCTQKSIVLNDKGEPYNPDFVKRIQDTGKKYFKD